MTIQEKIHQIKLQAKEVLVIGNEFVLTVSNFNTATKEIEVDLKIAYQYDTELQEIEEQLKMLNNQIQPLIN